MSGTAPVTTGPPLEARTNYQQMKMEARGSASRWGGGGPPPLPPDGSFPPTHRFSPPQTRRCAHTVCKRHSFYCRKHHVYRKSFVTKQIAISLRSLINCCKSPSTAFLGPSTAVTACSARPVPTGDPMAWACTALGPARVWAPTPRHQPQSQLCTGDLGNHWYKHQNIGS